MLNSKLKLLIVDDEPGTRSLMSQIFDRMGLAVTAAEDGFSALKEIRQTSPDVLLSDLNMPGMSGFELLSVVRRRFPGIQVIAMSGAFSGESIQPGVAADAFYEKASGISSLMRIMTTVTDPQQRFSKQPRESAPFWIQSDENTSYSNGFITISCPECLRTFPQESVPQVGSLNIHAVPCVYCSSEIHFAIIQSTNSAHPQPFQRKSGSVPRPPTRQCAQ